MTGGEVQNDLNDPKDRIQRSIRLSFTFVLIGD